jgi:hypothetical protein
VLLGPEFAIGGVHPRGWPILAVLHCAGSSVAPCTDTSHIPSFGEFTVYYPPDPAEGTVLRTLAFSKNGDLLWLGDGFCLPVAFDVRTDIWYRVHEDEIETTAAVLRGTAPRKWIIPTHHVSASVALSATSPPPKSADCPIPR